MKVWAEVRGGRVRHTFETSDDFTPVFGPPITVVEITARIPQPEAGWDYDKGAETFTVRAIPAPPVDADAAAALVIVETTGPFLADREADALRLILRKVYGV